MKDFGTCYTTMRNHFEITGELDKIPTKLQKKEKKVKVLILLFSIPTCSSKVVQAGLTDQSREGGNSTLSAVAI